MAPKTRKAATVADLIAAAALGTIDPSTPVITAEDAARQTAEAIQSAEHDRPAPTQIANTAEAVTLDPSHHECGVAGCRHGAGHSDTHQPDRQVKLACPTCGAVARMTSGAIRKAGGYPTCADGGQFAEAARRTYSRRAV